MITSEDRINILQVSTSDLGGGAERSAHNLFRIYKERGHKSWLAVGVKKTNNNDIYEFVNNNNKWVQWWDRILTEHNTKISRIRGFGRLLRILRNAGQPMRWIYTQLGVEDFYYPATGKLLRQMPEMPDILHCHNLHGGYFDLRKLPELSIKVPTILNLRDAWLLTGHCALPLNCKRWKTGCGKCPDLSLFPAVKRDATAFNWSKKKEIFRQSRVYVSTPSEWMMNLVQNSFISNSIIESRVIPNGVNTKIFTPKNKSASRHKLDLPETASILMTAGFSLRSNVWKDYETLHAAIISLGKTWRGAELILLVVGDTGHDEKIGNISIKYIPFQNRPEDLADYYCASDIYIHVAKVESFGNVLIEARACGTPVISTAVGGIPEHVRSLGWEGLPKGVKGYELSDANGILINSGDEKSIVKASEVLLNNSEILAGLGRNSIKDVKENYSLDIQANRFIEWYSEILKYEH